MGPALAAVWEKGSKRNGFFQAAEGPLVFIPLNQKCKLPVQMQWVNGGADSRPVAKQHQQY